jgi:hypothetical protein
MRTMLLLDDTPGTGELWRGNYKLLHQSQAIGRDLKGEEILLFPGGRCFAYVLTDAQVQERREGRSPHLPYRFLVYSPGEPALNWTAFYTEGDMRAFTDAYSLTVHGDLVPGSRFEIELPDTSAAWLPVTRRPDRRNPQPTSPGDPVVGLDLD